MQHTQSLCENNRFRSLYRQGEDRRRPPALVVYASKEPAEDGLAAWGSPAASS